MSSALRSAAPIVILTFLLCISVYAAPPPVSASETSGLDSDVVPGPIGRQPSQTPVGRKGVAPYYKGCTTFQRTIVQRAWEQAGQVAKAHDQWQAGGKWQDAMSLYMGTQSASDSVGHAFTTGLMKTVVERQYGLHHHNQRRSPYWTYAYFYCDESQVPKVGNRNPAVDCADRRNRLYTFVDWGTVFGWNTEYIVFCPSFFSSSTRDLTSVIAAAAVLPQFRSYIRLYQFTHTFMMLWATYSWYEVIGKGAAPYNPEIDPGTIAANAASNNIERTKRTPAAWALAGLAIYVQQSLGLPRPPGVAPIPHMTPGPAPGLEDLNITEANAPLGGVLSLGAAPDWFASPVALNSPDFKPDMTDVIQAEADSEVDPQSDEIIQTE